MRITRFVKKTPLTGSGIFSFVIFLQVPQPRWRGGLQKAVLGGGIESWRGDAHSMACKEIAFDGVRNIDNSIVLQNSQPRW